MSFKEICCFLKFNALLIDTALTVNLKKCPAGQCPWGRIFLNKKENACIHSFFFMIKLYYCIVVPTPHLGCILCLVLFEPIKIFCLPYMKSTSDEEAEKLFGSVFLDDLYFLFWSSSAGRDQNKNRDESKSFQKLFNFRIH